MVEVGGLMSDAFRLFLGNADVAVFIVTFTLFFGVVAAINVAYSHFED